jgi:hypothetical protein
MAKLINRKWALALIAVSMFGTAGATVAAAEADAHRIICPMGGERCHG